MHGDSFLCLTASSFAINGDCANHNSLPRSSSPMDPMAPAFQPGSPPPKPKLPAHNAVDPLRKRCRECGEFFQKGSQLMKHLRKTHWDTTVTRAPEAVRRRKPIPSPSARNPGQPQIHPFILMSQQQKLLFVVHVVYMLCCVAMKIHEQEETARQRENEKPVQPSDDRSQESPPPVEGTAGSMTGILQSAADIRPRQPGEDSDSEIVDEDEDGGVPLYSSSST
ncbi:uncharacterized protein B0T15DRAFT_281569 [Chaetomium strumarium]|uniref:C2H2-type domain-containing protein n=1 Tax=Chaetomium strumarium TaxID=1170767 RepID=A0AAJ0GPC5_9PEZI|nr:hypothetical protein B0T15DRAFT_281569 [Chaetomium strumarium]